MKFIKQLILEIRITFKLFLIDVKLTKLERRLTKIEKEIEAYIINTKVEINSIREYKKKTDELEVEVERMMNEGS